MKIHTETADQDLATGHEFQLQKLWTSELKSEYFDLKFM